MKHAASSSTDQDEVLQRMYAANSYVRSSQTWALADESDCGEVSVKWAALQTAKILSSQKCSLLRYGRVVYNPH